jgi:putative DNA primase/helicase
MTMQDVLDFQRAAEAYGLIFDGLPVVDGQEHRVATAAKPKALNGWYALHDDGNGLRGVYGDWATAGGAAQGWRAKGGKPMTMAELQAMQAAATARAQAMAADKQAVAERVAAEVRAMLAPDGGFRLAAEGDSTAGIAYLARKGFDRCPSSVWLDGATLVLPIREPGGAVVNLQRIYREDGEWQKRPVKGARKAGCWIEVPGRGKFGEGPIAIAEGYATAATMAAASGFGRWQRWMQAACWPLLARCESCGRCRSWCWLPMTIGKRLAILASQRHARQPMPLAQSLWCRSSGPSESQAIRT